MNMHPNQLASLMKCERNESCLPEKAVVELNIHTACPKKGHHLHLSKKTAKSFSFDNFSSDNNVSNAWKNVTNLSIPLFCLSTLFCLTLMQKVLINSD